jgi:two-component system sensor histidine kinase VicK
MRIGMRWWLAVAFAAVAATTAVAVAQVSSARSEAEFRERAQAIVAGNAFEATIDLRDDPLGRVAARRRLALFVFDGAGRLISPARSHGVPIARIADRRDAVLAALEGRRVVSTDESIRATTVALRFGGDDPRVLLAYASHPELEAELGIVRDEIDRAAWIALVVGGLVGAVIATLIALRLRRIGRAAAAIEDGDFETALTPDFPDEVGDLAATFDRMRNRLRASFRQVEADRDRLERLLERLQEGVVAVDADLTVQFANRVARSMLGELRTGAPLPEPWETESVRAFAAKLFSADSPKERRVRPDDERVFALAGVPAAPGELGILVIRDLTDEERRERAEREFVANASHELRTPLTTILGAIELLQAGAKDEPTTRDRFLTHIEREAGRLVRLTRALLVLARAQTREEQPRLTAVELKPLLDEVAASTRSLPGVDVQVRCDEGLYVAAEPDLLEQALANLAGNAAEHTQRGDIVIAAAGDGNGSVRIEVRDSGPGVPASIRGRVFDRFYRPSPTNGDGFGLGLAIVRQAVRAQDGTIELDDTPDGGTRVTIELARVDR